VIERLDNWCHFAPHLLREFRVARLADAKELLRLGLVLIFSPVIILIVVLALVIQLLRRHLLLLLLRLLLVKVLNLLSILLFHLLELRHFTGILLDLLLLLLCLFAHFFLHRIVLALGLGLRIRHAVVLVR
jgi:hypothetical protein